MYTVPPSFRFPFQDIVLLFLPTSVTCLSLTECEPTLLHLNWTEAEGFGTGGALQSVVAISAMPPGFSARSASSLDSLCILTFPSTRGGGPE